MALVEALMFLYWGWEFVEKSLCVDFLSLECFVLLFHCELSERIKKRTTYIDAVLNHSLAGRIIGIGMLTEIAKKELAVLVINKTRSCLYFVFGIHHLELLRQCPLMSIRALFLLTKLIDIHKVNFFVRYQCIVSIYLNNVNPETYLTVLCQSISEQGRVCGYWPSDSGEYWHIVVPVL